MSNNVLIFKTSNDFVMKDAINYSKRIEQNIFCFIQSSQIERYSKEYPDIVFFDCGSESFYDLSKDALALISDKSYSSVIIPITGPQAHNFGNIIDIVRLLDHDKLIFYHSDDNIQVINKMNKVKSMFYRIIIEFFMHLEKGERT